MDVLRVKTDDLAKTNEKLQFENSGLLREIYDLNQTNSYVPAATALKIQNSNSYIPTASALNIQRQSKNNFYPQMPMRNNSSSKI